MSSSSALNKLPNTEYNRFPSKLKIRNVILSLIILGTGVIMWIVIARLLWVNADAELGTLRECETHQSSMIPRAQCDGGLGVAPIRLNASNNCETFM